MPADLHIELYCFLIKKGPLDASLGHACTHVMQLLTSWKQCCSTSESCLILKEFRVVSKQWSWHSLLDSTQQKKTTASPAADEHLLCISRILFNTTLWSNSPSNPTYNPPPNVRAKFSLNKQFSNVAFEGKDGFTSTAQPPPLPVKANCCNNWVVVCWILARGSLVLLRKVHLSTLSCGRDESIPSRW